MSTLTPELIRNCRRCATELSPGALACDKCNALVYSEQLEQLAEEARALESNGEWQRARELWLSGLPLLPPSSTQAKWIAEHVRSLEATPDLPPTLAAQANPPVSRQRALSLSFLISFAIFIAVYSSASGARLGIGFAVLILIHEMGHYIDIRRRGLPAEMPMFLPGVGAYVKWRALGVSMETRAAISLAGPLAGFLAALACTAIWWQTRDPYWIVLARVGAALNLLNLIPVWMLDGGQAASALGKSERVYLFVATLVLWIVLRENFYIPLAAGAAYRAFFAKDLPARPSPATTVYFIAVMAALGCILRVLPGKGFGAL